jgi:hypothetical protein
MPYIDYKALKNDVSIEQTLNWLGIATTPDGPGKLRSACPACKSTDQRTIAITTITNTFRCWKSDVHGDIISLVAHILDISIKDAAAWILRASTGPQKTVTKPTSKTEEVSDHPFVKIAKGLQYDHEALTLQGISPHEAEAVSMGYKKNGLLRGMVVIPLRDAAGNVIRCIGLTPAQFAEIEIGKEFETPNTNVVSFPKKTA